MSYDYSSSDRQLNLPNPFKIENIFLGISAATISGLGLLLLFSARAKLNNSGAYGQYVALAVSIVLLAVAIKLAFNMLTQLRFFFGRGRPMSLAQELRPQQVGASPEANELKETLRQQALVFPEPQGALSGLLYSYVPNLIYAPRPIQGLANRQFKNAITMLVLLLSLVFALLFGRVGADEDSWQRVSHWIGLAYLGYVVMILMQPSGAMLAAREVWAELSPKGLVMAIVFAIVGPVILLMAAKFLPMIRGISPYPAVFVAMVVALLIYVLFFITLMRQVSQPPQTNVANKQESWNINCHPEQIVGELDRALQENWEEKIPNRCYFRQNANIDMNAKAGKFAAEIIEETQPFPVLTESLSFGAALSNPRYALLVLLNTAGTVLWCLAAGAMYVFGQAMINTGGGDTGMQPYTSLLYTIIFGALASFAFVAAHALWMRFDFTSRIVWLQLEGQYVTTRLDHGNQLNDTIRSSTNVIKIESMTYRLWCANLTSTTFGKDSARHIVAMAGDTNFTETMTLRLKEFALNQASIFAPVSRADLERHVALTNLNEASRDPETLQKLTSQLQQTATPQAVQIGATLLVQCPACGSGVETKDIFCGDCGQKLKAA